MEILSSGRTGRLLQVGGNPSQKYHPHSTDPLHFLVGVEDSWGNPTEMSLELSAA